MGSVSAGSERVFRVFYVQIGFHWKWGSARMFC